MIKITYLPGAQPAVETPQLQFVRALRLCYRYALRPATRAVQLTLHEDDLPRWSVAHRRMLLRVLLGLQAGGLFDTPAVNRGMGRWGLSSERGAVPPAARAVDAPRLAWPGLGTSLPGSALVVGDRPGAGWSGRLNWPFISGHRGGCSAWLAEQLEAGGVPETRLHWINATTQDGTPTSYVFVQLLRPKLIVALGRNAAKWCAGGNSTCDYEEVHHPQHWKRFHAGHAYHLVKVLRRGLSIQLPRRET